MIVEIIGFILLATTAGKLIEGNNSSSNQNLAEQRRRQAVNEARSRAAIINAEKRAMKK